MSASDLHYWWCLTGIGLGMGVGGSPADGLIWLVIVCMLWVYVMWTQRKPHSSAVPVPAGTDNATVDGGMRPQVSGTAPGDDAARTGSGEGTVESPAAETVYRVPREAEIWAPWKVGLPQDTASVHVRAFIGGWQASYDAHSWTVAQDVKALREEIEITAKQRTYAELKRDGEHSEADFIGAWDEVITRAREVLAKIGGAR